MNKSLAIYTLLLALSMPSYSATSKLTNYDLNKWKDSLNTKLPKSLRNWTDLRLSKSTKNKKCIVLKEEVWDITSASSTTDEKILYINPKCISQNDLKEIRTRNFNHLTMRKSKLKKELIRAIVKKELPFKLKRLKSRVSLYNNNFYKTPWTINLNIKASSKQTNLNFYQESVIHYMSNPNFFKLSPGAYKHLKYKLFNKRQYFKVTANLDNLIKKNKFMNYGKVKLIKKGNEALWTRYHMIKNAKKSIYISYFAWFGDVYGKGLFGLILKKLKENPKLDVVILVDGKGTFDGHHTDEIKQLIANGARVKVFNPVFLNWASIARTFKIGFIDGIVTMNHDKILLVDEKYMTTGGRNTGTQYFVKASEHKGSFIFKDTDILVEFEKPPITVLKSIFVEFESFFSRKVWSKKNIAAERELLSSLAAMEDRMNNREISPKTAKRYPELVNHKSIYGYNNWKFQLPNRTVPVRGYDNTSRLNRIVELTDKFYDLIDNAQEEIYLQNPYVVLTKRALGHLKRASDRGVKIYLSTGSHLATDSTLTVNHLDDNWRNILRTLPNARLFGYLGPEKSHSKTFVFDRKTTMVGSFNLDIISESINSEFSVVVEDEILALEEIGHIEDVIAKSYEYLLEGDLGPESIPGARAKAKYKKNKGIGYKIIGWISRPWL